MFYRKKKKYEVGSQHKINNGSTALVIRYDDHCNIFILILETGTLARVSSAQLSSGKIRDPYLPNPNNGSFLGSGDYHSHIFVDGKRIISPSYILWKAMLDRVTNYRAYKNVEVCEDWLCYQDFCEDLPNIPGYDRWMKGEKLHFDKDFMQMGEEYKIYSPSTCLFLPASVNCSPKTMKKLKLQGM